MPQAGAADVTTVLGEWRAGCPGAAERLVPLVHARLHRMARRHIGGEQPGHLLQATALVNEAFLRLLTLPHVPWQDRTHFFAMSARLMRRTLVDYARKQRNRKRGGDLQRVTFTRDMPVAVPAGSDDHVAIHEALRALATDHPRKAAVVRLRFFGGLSVEETAVAIEVSVETVMRDWRFAKSWLRRELARSRSRMPSPA